MCIHFFIISLFLRSYSKITPSQVFDSSKSKRFDEVSKSLKFISPFYSKFFSIN